MPVQPVVITDECGNLVGLPVPLNIDMTPGSQTTDINPNTTVTIFDLNPWNNVSGEVLLWITLEVNWVDAPNYQERWPFRAYWHVIHCDVVDDPGDPTIHYIEDLYKPLTYKTGATQFSFIKLVPTYPIPIAVNGRLALQITNYTNHVIDIVNYQIYHEET